MSGPYTHRKSFKTREEKERSIRVSDLPFWSRLQGGESSLNTPSPNLPPSDRLSFSTRGLDLSRPMFETRTTRHPYTKGVIGSRVKGKDILPKCYGGRVLITLLIHSIPVFYRVCQNRVPTRVMTVSNNTSPTLDRPDSPDLFHSLNFK